jgi:hypothetical protein
MNQKFWFTGEITGSASIPIDPITYIPGYSNIWGWIFLSWNGSPVRIFPGGRNVDRFIYWAVEFDY